MVGPTCKSGAKKKERLDSVVRSSSDRSGFNREENCNEISVYERLLYATFSGEDANDNHIHTNSYRLEPKTEFIPFLDLCEAKNYCLQTISIALVRAQLRKAGVRCAA